MSSVPARDTLPSCADAEGIAPDGCHFCAGFRRLLGCTSFRLSRLLLTSERASFRSIHSRRSDRHVVVPAAAVPAPALIHHPSLLRALWLGGVDPALHTSVTRIGRCSHLFRPTLVAGETRLVADYLLCRNTLLSFRVLF